MRVNSILLVTLLGAAPVAGSTLQEQYNSAQAAFDAGRMADARAGFAAVLPRLDRNPRAAAQAAVVRARLGIATLVTGDAEAAIPLIEKAVAGLLAEGAEQQRALLDLGRAYEAAIDFAAATKTYRKLLAVPAVDPQLRLGATVGLVRTLMFFDPVAARQFADDALAQAAAVAPVKRNDTVAILQMLRGRIELNDGKPQEARKWLEKALASAGGLGTQVNVADLRIRGDLALAAFLSKDLEATRRYLAFTGAGGLPEQGFEMGADMPLPPCAPVGPVARDDMAIVEFALASDGRVNNVTPIYVTRRGGPELAFAQAVRTWSWRASDAKALPLFWRQAVRMELRCVNKGAGTEVWGVGPVTRGWLAENAPEPMPEALRGDADALPILRAELARREVAFGADSPQLLPVLIALDANQVSSVEETLAAVQAGQSIATAANAPRDLLLFFRMRKALLLDYKAKDRRGSRDEYGSIPVMEKLLAQFDDEGAGQTRGSALIATWLATGYAKNVDKREAMYRRVLAVPLSAMPDGDPLRQIARLQLASIEAEKGSRVDVARSLLAATGLSPDQCSAFPITPIAARATSVSEKNFPREALAWRFEGTVRVAYDLDETGKPVDVRTVIASPPFVFDEATENVARSLRYKPIFRDGAAIACSDLQQGVRYRIQMR